MTSIYRRKKTIYIFRDEILSSVSKKINGKKKRDTIQRQQNQIK